MGLPIWADTVIRLHLEEIQKIFNLGAKVLLVVDNGVPERALVCGDADFERAIAIIRQFAEPAEQPAVAQEDA